MTVSQQILGVTAVSKSRALYSYLTLPPQEDNDIPGAAKRRLGSYNSSATQEPPTTTFQLHTSLQDG